MCTFLAAMLGQGCQRLLPYFAATVIASLLAFAAPAAFADPPPPGSTWTETYIDEPDGTQLHADIMRPSHLAPGTKTPVILSIGPYFNHSGQVGPAGPAEDVPYTPTGDAGPSARFFDFVEGAKLMERGYTYVMVDLRGFGGSSGCLASRLPGAQLGRPAALAAHRQAARVRICVVAAGSTR